MKIEPSTISLPLGAYVCVQWYENIDPCLKKSASFEYLFWFAHPSGFTCQLSLTNKKDNNAQSMVSNYKGIVQKTVST